MASAVSTGMPRGQQLSNKRSHRFGCEKIEIEWTLTNADGINYIISQLLLNGASWLAMNQSITEVQAVANKNSNMADVRLLLENARRTNDVTYLLRAYTVECDFYRTLNQTLAKRVDTSSMGNPIKSLLNLLMSDEDDDTPNSDWPLCFVGPIFDDMFSTNHSRYQYKGRAYRGANISQSELNNYVVGKLVFNKAFTSTSKQRHIAERFISSQKQKQNNTMAAIFVFLFVDNNINFTVDLKGISTFPDEEEVLIMPGIPFRITKINRGNPIEIELEQLAISHLLGRK